MQAHPLRLGSIHREEDAGIVEGVLLCSNAACQREFPILDGIPLLLPALRAYVRDNIFSLVSRDDLGAVSESLLGDGCGPGSPFDTVRQYVSSYAWDHWGDLDPKEPPGEPRPGSIVRLLNAGLEAAGPLAAGPLLDVGCAVGRTTFALAEQSEELVLGIDLNFALLRVAAQVLRRGRVQYPRRRVGLVYDRREFPVQLARAELVDFWACDATALPFAAGTFSGGSCLNVLDSVAAPADLLRSLGRGLTPGGKAVLACPYDWTASVTPVETWLGGHSQRGPDGGASEPVLRALLTPGGHPWASERLRLVREIDRVPWHVRLHERAAMLYQVHLAVAECV